jgi:hypothetical protein
VRTVEINARTVWSVRIRMQVLTFLLVSHEQFGKFGMVKDYEYTIKFFEKLKILTWQLKMCKGVSGLLF